MERSWILGYKIKNVEVFLDCNQRYLKIIFFYKINNFIPSSSVSFIQTNTFAIHLLLSGDVISCINYAKVTVQFRISG